MKFAMHKATCLPSSPQHSPINFSLDTWKAKDEARNYSLEPKEASERLFSCSLKTAKRPWMVCLQFPWSTDQQAQAGRARLEAAPGSTFRLRYPAEVTNVLSGQIPWEPWSEGGGWRVHRLPHFEMAGHLVLVLINNLA